MQEFQIILTNTYDNISGQISRDNEVRIVERATDGVHLCRGREEAKVILGCHEEIIVKNCLKPQSTVV